MPDLDRLLADLSRVAITCNEFRDPELAKAAFNIAITVMDLPPRPEMLPTSRPLADQPTEFIAPIRRD